MSKKMQPLFILLLLALPFAAAQVPPPAPQIQGWWQANTQSSISVQTGMMPDVFVSVLTADRAFLSIDILDSSGNLVRNVLTNLQIPGSLTNPYSALHTIDTTGLTPGQSYTVRLAAQNQHGTNTVQLTLQLTAAQNTPPTVTEIGGQPVGIPNLVPIWTFTEGQPGMFSITASDAQNDPITYQVRRQGARTCTFSLRSTLTDLTCLMEDIVNRITGGIRGDITLVEQLLPPGAQLNSMTGVFSWTPDFTYVVHPSEERQVVLEFRACDGQACSDWFPALIRTEDVNRNPQITSTPTTTATEGMEYTYPLQVQDLDAEDRNRFSYTLLSSPAGMSVDASGTVRWTPGSQAFEQMPAGGYTVLVRVDDNAYGPSTGGNDQQTWMITVINVVNTPPSLAPISPATFTEGQEGTLQFTATDAENDPIRYEIRNVPQGAILQQVSNSATFRWTPPFTTVTHPQQTSQVTFEVRACDPTPGCSAWQTVTLTVNDVNQAPTINPSPAPAGTATEGITYQYQISATDPDTEDALTYDLTTAPAGMTISPTGLISWTPASTAVENGPAYNVAVRVRDNAYGPGTGLTDTLSWTVTVQEGPANQPPVLAAIGDRTIAEGQELRFTVTATDPENDPLTFSVTGLPQGAAFQNNEFVWTPNFMQAGAYILTFSVRDNAGNIDTEIITITVTDVPQNRPPVLNPIGDRTVTEGTQLQFTVTATDPDNDPLTYTARNLPMGAQFMNQQFSWTPDFTQSGSYSTTFVVTDTAGEQDVETITITVIDAGTGNQPPLITSRPRTEAAVNELYQYQITATDPEGDPLSYSLLDAPPGMTITPNGQVQWTSSQAGRYRVTIAVTDGTSTITQEFTINVAGVAEADLKIVGAHAIQEIVSAGDLAFFSVGLRNEGTRSASGSISVSVFELGLHQGQNFRIAGKERTQEHLQLFIPPNAPSGEYLVKVRLDAGGESETVYRQLVII